MERLCFTFETHPGTATEYKRRHDEIWPELVADIKAAGQSNYSLFRHGDRIIGYVECDPDVATCLASLASSEANANGQSGSRTSSSPLPTRTVSSIASKRSGTLTDATASIPQIRLGTESVLWTISLCKSWSTAVR